MRTRAPIARRGFTFGEVLFALFVLAAVCAFSWPVLKGVMSVNALRQAGRQVRNDISTARLQAMTTGLVHVLRFEPETGRYSIEALADETDLEYGLRELRADIALVPDPKAAAAVPKQQELELPEGCYFEAVELEDDERRQTMLNESEAKDLTSPLIMMYPDGTLSSGTLLLHNEENRHITIRLQGPVGAVEVGEPARETQPAEKPAQEFTEIK